MSAVLPGLFCILSILLNQVEAGCTWSVWSPCSVTCGKGTRSRNGTGSDCTQSPTETCSTPTSCYATHLANLNVTVTQHPKNINYPSRAKSLMIDGMPSTVNGQSIFGSSCAATDQGDNPWVRLDLKKTYLVSVVRVIIHGGSGQDVAIRVGSSLINNGNDNHQCGTFPYDYAESGSAIWRNVSCSPPVWGRYINFDRTVTNGFLEICEVSFTYDDVMADMTITKDGSDINGISVTTTQGQGLGQPVTCSVVNSTNNGYLTWKHQNNLVQNFSSEQQPGIYQVSKKNSQLLYINKSADSDAGVYSCEYSLEEVILLSKSFIFVGYATHLANLNVTVTQHPENKNIPGRPKTLMIDGLPTPVNGQKIAGSSCAATNKGKNPWVRLDLKKAYLVSVVRVIIFGGAGQNVAIRVGSNLTNNGNDNHQCGTFPYDHTERELAIWRTISCSLPVWGRYINFDRTVTDGFLEICEISFTFDAILHIRIESKVTDVDGHRISVYQGDGLANSIDCSIEPDSSGFTVPLTWKHNGSDVQTLSSGQSFGIYQMNERGIQRLYINNTTDSDDGTYSCEASASNVVLFPKSFTLQFKVDCMWSSWSACTGSCGIGSRHRSVATLEQHDGKKCTGPMQQKCDTNRPPCVPYLDELLSVDEGMAISLSCHATQFAALSDPIRFGWFKVKGQSDVPVIIDGRVINSTQNDSQGNFTGKLMIRIVSRTDNGLYKCKAFSVHGSSDLSTPASLSVTYGPESIAIHPTHPLGIKGKDIMLNCSATGNPTPSYEWQLSQGQTSAGQTLQLSKIQFKDGGTYTCIATNTIGAGVKTSRISVTLTVEGPPQKCSKPSVFSYEGSTVSVNLSCEKDGNSPITEYEIQYNTTLSGDWKSVKFMASINGPFLVQGLMPFTYYAIRVRAANKYLYEEGDMSFSDPVIVMTSEGAPSSPMDVTVSVLSPYSLQVQWKPPRQPNGDLQFYKVYYKRTSSSGGFSVSRSIPIEDNSFNVSELDPYTSYDIYVTVTNNAENNPESQPSQAVQERTHTAPPILPQLPDPPDNQGQFTAPDISDSNGPISYICIIIYRGPLDGISPSNIPEDVGADSGESKEWYIAAKYTYQEYESNIAGKSFTIGNGQTTSANGEEYTNVEVVSGYKYSIYFRIVASGDNINEVYDVVTEPFQYAITSLSSSSSSDCVDFTIVIIVAVVPTTILLTVIAVLVGIIIKLKRHTFKLDDPASTKEYVYMKTKLDEPVSTKECVHKETTLLQSSEAYGITVMQSGKSDERNYEELPSNTEKANEPMYTSIVN